MYTGGNFLLGPRGQADGMTAASAMTCMWRRPAPGRDHVLFIQRRLPAVLSIASGNHPHGPGKVIGADSNTIGDGYEKRTGRFSRTLRFLAAAVSQRGLSHGGAQPNGGSEAGRRGHVIP